MPDESSLALTREVLREIIDRSLERRRQGIVYHLARKLEPFLRIESESRAIIEEQTWTKIASLSQLRTSVGGRFSKLKERWIGAGLPLREHRGDTNRGGKINPEGFELLCSWIIDQGYEVRAAPEVDNRETASWFFEVRPR